MGGRGVNTTRSKRAPRFEGFEPASRRASETARQVPRTGTKAELALRRALSKLGLRYRLNVSDVPGKPDIVFRKAKVAVFVDGDFWHGREWRRRRAKLAEGANASYWVAKIAANMARDRRKTRTLAALGWRVLRLWERDVLADPAAAAAAVASALSPFQRPQ